MIEKLLHEHDIKRTRIIIVKNKTNVEDIIIQYPANFGWENVSFLRSGLLNVLPGSLKASVEADLPLVEMTFLGELVEEELEY